jgi:hypothetical protein
MKTLQRAARSGSGVFESCHHHADAADARSIQRHGPPLSYSGRNPWKESASRPPKGAFEGAEAQVCEEALHSRITSGWSKSAAGTDVHETGNYVPGKGLSFRGGLNWRGNIGYENWIAL